MTATTQVLKNVTALHLDGAVPGAAHHRHPGQLMYDQTQYVITFTADAEVTPAPKEDEE
jgi:hypothetical protein